jgi:hypothetical protein
MNLIYINLFLYYGLSCLKQTVFQTSITAALKSSYLLQISKQVYKYLKYVFTKKRISFKFQIFYILLFSMTTFLINWSFQDPNNGICQSLFILTLVDLFKYIGNYVTNTDYDFFTSCHICYLLCLKLLNLHCIFLYIHPNKPFIDYFINLIKIQDPGRLAILLLFLCKGRLKDLEKKASYPSQKDKLSLSEISEDLLVLMSHIYKQSKTKRVWIYLESQKYKYNIPYVYSLSKVLFIPMLDVILLQILTYLSDKVSKYYKQNTKENPNTPVLNLQVSSSSTRLPLIKPLFMGSGLDLYKDPLFPIGLFSLIMDFANDYLILKINEG